MMESWIKGLIVLLLSIIGMVIFLVIMLIYPPQREMCLERELEKDCGSRTRECYDDCNKLGFEYFRYDTGGFASEECWCKINNGTKQIW